MDKELTRLLELRSEYAAALAATDAAIENRIKKLATTIYEWPSETDFYAWIGNKNITTATKAWRLLVGDEMKKHLARFGIQLDIVENRVRKESLFAAYEHLHPRCAPYFGDRACSFITGWIKSLKGITPTTPEP